MLIKPRCPSLRQKSYKSQSLWDILFARLKAAGSLVVWHHWPAPLPVSRHWSVPNSPISSYCWALAQASRHWSSQSRALRHWSAQRSPFAWSPRQTNPHWTMNSQVPLRSHWSARLQPARHWSAWRQWAESRPLPSCSIQRWSVQITSCATCLSARGSAVLLCALSPVLCATRRQVPGREAFIS
jgi:hypothetical protein